MASTVDPTQMEAFEEGDVRELLVHYGLAMYFAQALEYSLGAVVVSGRLKEHFMDEGNPVDEDKADQLTDCILKKNLGHFRTCIDPALVKKYGAAEIFKEAVKTRNSLAHKI